MTEGEWAVGVVIKQLKKRYSATSMMEITVCGAVPPYNHLLGGKLVCLMMMSPRVVQDYQARYKDVVSIIASQMAGRPITKVPHLNFLGTTSLYTDHSAQYNRVRLPLGGSMPFCVELDNLKDTDAPIHQPAAMLVAAD